MIEVILDDGNPVVKISGKEVEILDGGDNYFLARCELDDLRTEIAAAFPPDLELLIQSEDGFGTYFFHDLYVAADDDGVSLEFRCHTPNKYWEGRFGLATFIAAIQGQAQYLDGWEVTEIELEDDWKSITLRRVVNDGDPLHGSILAAASDLKKLLEVSEIALSGLQWKAAYLTDENLFCEDLLYPLLCRMGFLFVRYTHGTREYGKDFTFSEITPFGNHRHYGLQAKAGDVKGGVNSTIDEIIGQLSDAFAMPYYELGSNEPRYISTFVIAISGAFTENAREKIVGKMSKGVIGSVYFLDRERITELVEKYWKGKPTA